jgi:hypothetical protein
MAHAPSGGNKGRKNRPVTLGNVDDSMEENDTVPILARSLIASLPFFVTVGHEWGEATAPLGGAPEVAFTRAAKQLSGIGQA